MALIDSLIAWYKCDEAADTNLTDAHDNALHLTKHGSTGPGSASGHHANVGNCRTYNGSDQYHDHATNDLFRVNGNQSFWISFWVKFDTLSAYQWLVSKDDASSNREYAVLYHDGNDRIQFILWASDNSQVTVDWGSAPSTATWYHVMCWYDAAATPKIWISINDGTPVSTTNTIGGTATSGISADFVVGGYAFHSLLLDGNLNEVAFGKGYVPDSTDRSFLYNSGNGVTYEDLLGTDLALECPVFEEATNTTCSLSRNTATGGNAPYTYQWQRSDNGADGTWNDLSGETAATLDDNDSLVAGTTYWWRVEVTDDNSTVAFSPPVPGKLWPAPMAIGFIGDSLTDATVAPANMVSELPRFRQRLVTLESNEAVSGAQTEDWLPGASPNLLGDAITQFTSDGVTHVHIMLGNNDATNGGTTPISASEYRDNLQNICDELVSEGFKVIVSGPSFNALLQDDNEHAQALLDYLAVIPDVCDGVDVFLGDLTAVYYYAQNQDQLSDGEHMTSTGQTNLGKLWAQAAAASLYSATGGGSLLGGRLVR